MKTAGKSIQQADKALILIHGRGGSAEDILRLAPMLAVQNFALFAPKAANRTWYPYSFMAPREQNEPWLSAALTTLENLVEDIIAEGIAPEGIYFLGFSQGACLTLEFVASFARRYGGVVAFTGGLIGEALEAQRYKGDLKGTPILITTGEPDPHVPLQRVKESDTILKSMNASVSLKVYPNRPHTISHEEFHLANQQIFQQ